MTDKLSEFFVGMLLRTIKGCSSPSRDCLKLNISISDLHLLKTNFSTIFTQKYSSHYGKLTVYTEEEYFKPIKEIQKFSNFKILESKKAFGREIDGQKFEFVTHL